MATETKTKHDDDEEKVSARHSNSRPNSSRGAGGGGSYAALLPKRAREGATVSPFVAMKQPQRENRDPRKAVSTTMENGGGENVDSDDGVESIAPKTTAPHAPSGVSRGLERRTEEAGHRTEADPRGGGERERGEIEAEHSKKKKNLVLLLLPPLRRRSSPPPPPPLPIRPQSSPTTSSSLLPRLLLPLSRRGGGGSTCSCCRMRGRLRPLLLFFRRRRRRPLPAPPLPRCPPGRARRSGPRRERSGPRRGP